MCEELKRKLLSRTVVTDDGCWMWTGAWSRGYGQIYWKGQLLATHQVSYIIYNGLIPEDKFVLHICDNSWCINPEHLFAGTQQDNMDDKVAKRRQAIGEMVGTAKLKAEQVIEIRRLLIEDTITQKEIAEDFGVDPKLITQIKYRRIWKHI